MHLKPCVRRKEDNYFFALSKYQKSLEETLEQNPEFLQPSFRLNEVRQCLAFLFKKGNVQELSSFSRINLFICT